MNPSSAQLVFVALIAALLAVFVAYAARKQRLSFRYTVGWFVLLGISILSGVLIPLVGPIADAFSLSAAAVLIGISVSILLAVSIQLSISISGLQREVQRLNEDIAILRARIQGE